MRVDRTNVCGRLVPIRVKRFLGSAGKVHYILVRRTAHIYNIVRRSGIIMGIIIFHHKRSNSDGPGVRLRANKCRSVTPTYDVKNIIVSVIYRHVST